MQILPIGLGAFSSPLLLAASLATLLAVASNIWSLAAGAGVIDLASSLERGAAPDHEYIQKFVAARDVQNRDANCGDAYSRAALTVSLASLRDASRVDGGVAGPALERALAAAQARLSCSPVDGNAWLQWAQLKFHVGAAGTEVFDGVKRSALFAPAESWILAPRLDFEATLATSDAGDIELQFNRDLRQFVEYASTSAVAAAYVQQSASVRSRLRVFIEAQTDTRRRLIVAEIDRLGVDLAKP